MKSGKPTGYLRIGTFPYFSISNHGYSKGSTGENSHFEFYFHESGGTRQKRFRSCRRDQWLDFMAYIYNPSGRSVTLDFNKNRGYLKIGPIINGFVQFEYSICEDSRGKTLTASREISLDDIWLPWSADPIQHRGPKAVILFAYRRLERVRSTAAASLVLIRR